MFNENVRKLRRKEPISDELSSVVLLQGVPNQYSVDLKPIYDMAAETFTYLGLGLMNPASRLHTPITASGRE
ncbi:hypothetical protein Hypma_005574 [Hypsizygus marmoreus]|uniref:Uncharacterized protein n=1 Tax=Hypsizygus marmoreus TaxID=39966 RepID=A0A369K419_HYPMA|nr:hypothetical protein Hypma_005574 [Hypsizygus marmoreus]